MLKRKSKQQIQFQSNGSGGSSPLEQPKTLQIQKGKQPQKTSCKNPFHDS